MTQRLFDSISLVVIAAGVVVLLLGGSHPRWWRTALPVAMELWAGAGLLRLVGGPDWARVATAAAIIAIRRLVLLRLVQQAS